jgi:sodium pump decarboxylase gamma subunit
MRILEWDGDVTMDKVTLALTILVTGLVVVFCLLLLLTFVIKGYSTVVYRVQQKKSSPPVKATPAPVPVAKAAAPVASAGAQKVEAGIPGEVIAAIAAAVSVLGEQNGSVYAIKSVKRALAARPVWASAGLMENTRPF